MAPYDRNLFRTEVNLTSSLGRLDQLWKDINETPTTIHTHAIKAREAAAMTATARWMYNAARVRTETRGMHKREDFPQIDATQRYRTLSGGLDQVWVKKKLLGQEVVSV
ncbi:L-aspartate oxidase [compost metagenome]